MNRIHCSGYGIKDDIQRKFFINRGDPNSNDINISNIAFNPELNDYDHIAAAMDTPPYNNEDNRIALMIVELRSKNLFTREAYDESTGRYGLMNITEILFWSSAKSAWKPLLLQMLKIQ